MQEPFAAAAGGPTGPQVRRAALARAAGKPEADGVIAVAAGEFEIGECHAGGAVEQEPRATRTPSLPRSVASQSVEKRWFKE